MCQIFLGNLALFNEMPSLSVLKQVQELVPYAADNLTSCFRRGHAIRAATCKHVPSKGIVIRSPGNVNDVSAIVSFLMVYSIFLAFYGNILGIICLGQLEAFDLLGLAADVSGVVFHCLGYACRISPPVVFIGVEVFLLLAAFALLTVLVVPLPFAIVFLFFYIAKIIKIIQIASRLLMIY